MKYRFHMIGLALGVLVLGLGCAVMPKTASGPAFAAAQVPEGKAVVYFFRTQKFMMSANTIFMSIPKAANNCFGMVPGGYYPYVTEPGRLTVGFAARDGEKDFTIDLKAGDARYVQVDFSDDLVPASFYKEIPEAEAAPKMSKYRTVSPCR